MRYRQDIRYIRVRCPECGRRAEMIAPLQPGRWTHHTAEGAPCPCMTAVPDKEATR